MGILSTRFSQSSARVSAPLLAILLAIPDLAAGQRDDLLNPWEIYNEIHVDVSAAPAVKDFFPTFLDYQDVVMFHPKVGYYSSGRVNFVDDYRTFPDALSPYFGHMIAAQLFKMWDGMRKAGTLAPNERFTIAEFGAGDGALAESILDYIDLRAAGESGAPWREFARQTTYACYDRSPALSALQAKRNKQFGARFEARRRRRHRSHRYHPRSQSQGSRAFQRAARCLQRSQSRFLSQWRRRSGLCRTRDLRRRLEQAQERDPADLQKRLQSEGLSIQSKVFAGKRDGLVYLSKAGFVALLEALASAKDYAGKLDAIEFHEIYVPVETIPELADHVRKYIPQYAYELARGSKGFAAYINLGEGRFIRGAGRILKAGYVVTIDYGANWDTVPPIEFNHFRSFGPGSNRDHSNPYHSPTFNDMTTDVNFSHLAEEGRASGLRPVFFGAQHTMITGTPVSIDTPPPNCIDVDDYNTWVENFYTWDVYKILVQQKETTDPSYSFPDDRSEALTVAAESLGEAQRVSARQIEKRLRDRLAPH